MAKNHVELTPPQRYRIRKSHPLPKSLSATKFAANNYFDEEIRGVLDGYFARSKYPISEDLVDMMAKTGLRANQIKNYFKNKRSRTKALDPNRLGTPGKNKESVDSKVGEEVDIMTNNDSLNSVSDVLFSAFDLEQNLNFAIDLSQFTDVIKSEMN